MKTLNKFVSSNCIIKVQMQSAKEVASDYKIKLYRVTTTIKYKNTWKEYYKEFIFSREANKYMIEEINYWLI